MIWFTSDAHFGHANVLKFTERYELWGDVDAMGRALVANINAAVAPTDELYHLGNFSFKMTAEEAAAIRRQIRCRRVHLVPGNHDKDWSQPAVAGATSASTEMGSSHNIEYIDMHLFRQLPAKMLRRLLAKANRSG